VICVTLSFEQDVRGIEFWIESVECKSSITTQMNARSAYRGELILHSVHVLQRPEWHDDKQILCLAVRGACLRRPATVHTSTRTFSGRKTGASMAKG
jgi:hypothetical protein